MFPPKKTPPVNWGSRGTLAACSCAKTPPCPQPPCEHTCLHRLDPSCMQSHSWHQLPLSVGCARQGGHGCSCSGALCPLYTSPRDTSAHAAWHVPQRQHDSETLPAWAPYSQHPHVPGCAHMFLCMYLCTYTHTHKYMHVCLSVRIPMCSHAFKHMCIQASSPPGCADMHSCAHTHMLTEMLVHGHVFTGTHGIVLTCREGRVCTHLCMHTHISAHTCAHCVRAHTLHTQHGHVHVHKCTSVHTVCTCTHTVCAYTLVCTHTRTHTYTHVCVHKQKCM